MLNLKKDFPFLVANPKLVYLDSACTSIKPESVINAEASYYREYAACANRSSHLFGRKASEKIEAYRSRIVDFLSAKGAELVWTNNTTEALNTVIFGLDYSKRRKVVTTAMEHHAVLLPLMRLRDEGKIDLEIADGSGNEWGSAIDRKTALVVTNSADNTIGSTQDIKAIAKIAHENGALMCVDGAQGVPHHQTKFNDSGADFLCFSGHKMLGPTGIGGLVMKKERMKELKPLVLGGGTVKTVTLDLAEPADDFTLFEAGIQNYAGVFGLAAACDYLSRIGMDNVEKHEKELAELISKQLDRCGAIVYGPAHPAATYSFNLKGGKPHDVALMLDKENIAVRSGFFCAQPALQKIGAKDGAVRVSGYIYNTPEDIKKFGDALEKISVVY